MSRMLSLRLIHAMHALTSFSTPLVLAATLTLIVYPNMPTRDLSYTSLTDI